MIKFLLRLILQPVFLRINRSFIRCIMIAMSFYIIDSNALAQSVKKTINQTQNNKNTQDQDVIKVLIAQNETTDDHADDHLAHQDDELGYEEDQNIATTSQQSSSDVFSLLQALEIVYEQSPVINGARSQLYASGENIKQAEGAWHPNISVVITGGRTNTRSQSSASQPQSTSVINPRSGRLEINQNLYNGGSDRAEIEAAESTYQSSQYNFSHVEQSLMVETASAYRALYRDLQLYHFNDANVGRLEQLLKGVRDLFDIGQSTLTEVLQADARLIDGKADLIAAQGQIDISRAVFKRIIGIEHLNLEEPVLHFAISKKH
ncbi:MAG: TolC family protein [Pseudomonadota bacterium]